MDGEGENPPRKTPSGFLPPAKMSEAKRTRARCGREIGGDENPMQATAFNFFIVSPTKWALQRWKHPLAINTEQLPADIGSANACYEYNCGP